MKTSIGKAMIKFFTDLEVAIGVDFLVIRDAITSLLSIHNKGDNILCTSRQCHQVSVGKYVLKLKMEKYFRIHQWYQDNMPFALYMETELKKIRQCFIPPPSVQRKVCSEGKMGTTYVPRGEGQ